jgi:hypothetical protein
MSSVFVPRYPQQYDRPSSQSFALGVSAIYFVLQLVNILHHPMWRDEMQVWELARQSKSIANLLYLKRYEGHPDAWYLLVYLLQRITKAPVAMQLLHLSIATLSTYLLLRYAPFSRLQKVLAVFGYFLFFEYATISRGYALGVLFLFSFCVAFQPNAKRYGLRFLLLAALAQTSAYGLILACAFAAMTVADSLAGLRVNRELFVAGGRLWAWGLVFIIAAGASIFQIVSIGDPSAYATQSNHQLTPADIGYALTAISRGFLPIPQLTRHFWNTHLLHGTAEGMSSIAILCVSIMVLIPVRPVLLAYGSGLFGILLLRYLKPSATHFLRHDGHVFLLFLACAWINCLYSGGGWPQTGVGRLGRFFVFCRNPLITGLLAIQAIVGALVSGIAYNVPFSQAKATADYLRASKLYTTPIVADPDYAISTVAGYLDQPVFFVSGHRMGTSVVWDSMCCVRQNQLTLQSALNRATDSREDVLVLLNYVPVPIDRRIQEIASFQGAIVEDENYHLYLVRYKDVGSGECR